MRNKIIIYLFFTIAFTQVLIAQTRVEKKYGGYGHILSTTEYTNLGGGREQVVLKNLGFSEAKVLSTTIYFTVNGKMEGEYKYYSLSNLIDHFIYKNGLLNGDYLRYHENGKIQYKGQYVNGKKEGSFLSYYFEGVLINEGRYINDNKEGDWKYYHKNGRINTSGICSEDKKQGIWRRYFENGTLESVTKYIDGEADKSFVSNEAVSTPCPNPKKLMGLSMYIDSKQRDPNPQGPNGQYDWKWQRKMFEAACVDAIKDSEEEIGRKISSMMKQHEAKLEVNNTKFDVSNGNIIKFAVNLKFDEFLIWMAKWKVDFNKVDVTDGRTVLDYVSDQIIRNKGLPQEPVLKGYYNMIKKAGGKHKYEL